MLSCLADCPQFATDMNVGWRAKNETRTDHVFFPYEFDRYAGPLLRLVGVRADRDGVRVEGDRMIVSFGFLNTTVSLANITETSVTGPYLAIKAIGPRLSAADHGITFGTTSLAGVCVSFDKPIPAVFGPWSHPGMTVTVADPNGLVAAIRASK